MANSAGSGLQGGKRMVASTRRNLEVPTQEGLAYAHHGERLNNDSGTILMRSFFKAARQPGLALRELNYLAYQVVGNSDYKRFIVPSRSRTAPICSFHFSILIRTCALMANF